MKYSWEISCPHNADSSIPHDRILPDHHPLSTEQIKALLDQAKSEGGHVVSKVQVRLIQGIVGMQCPRQIDGPVAERSTRLGRIFVDRYYLGGTPDLVEAIELAMRG